MPFLRYLVCYQGTAFASFVAGDSNEAWVKFWQMFSTKEVIDMDVYDYDNLPEDKFQLVA